MGLQSDTSLEQVFELLGSNSDRNFRLGIFNHFFWKIFVIFLLGMGLKFGPQSGLEKSLVPPSTSSLVIQRTNFRALKYSNIGALFSRSASNIHTLTLARVTAVYRCFSSEFRTLCWLGSKVRALGRPVCCRTSGRKYIIQVFIIRMDYVFCMYREKVHTKECSCFTVN